MPNRVTLHTAEFLRSPLKGRAGEWLVNKESTAERLRVRAKDLGFLPEAILLTDGKPVVLQYLIPDEACTLPAWVFTAADRFSAAGDLCLLLVAPDCEDSKNLEFASCIVEECVARGIGLAIEVRGRLHLVTSPHMQIQALAGQQEHGHIPSWVIEGLLDLPCLSDFLAKKLKNFAKEYKELTQSAPANEDEANLLMSLAHRVADGDHRLFFPMGRLEMLREFEETVGGGARDHFFHTFNDFFLGLLLLGRYICTFRDGQAIPEVFLEDAGGVAELRPWEALWTLTALFHDPGYLAEKMNVAFLLATGLKDDGTYRAKEIDSTTAARLNNEWETGFLCARLNIDAIFQRVRNTFAPYGSITKFQQGLRTAYFDGDEVNHSVMSGFALIERCRNLRGVRRKHFDKDLTVTASSIAALGILFHDGGSRAKMQLSGIGPISFDLFPFAGTLMFVDAVQDDRRDIAAATFPVIGTLNCLTVDPISRRVSAVVDLRHLPLSWWPWKIAEYQDVLEWLGFSDTKFSVDYLHSSGIAWI